MQPTSILSEARFEALLAGRPFLPFEGGLLFYHEQWQKYVVAEFRPDTRYTTQHFFELPETAPYQLIDGKFVQTMGASLKHQEVAGNLYALLNLHIREHQLGKVLFAPTDVVLGDHHVFQPDILYVSVARQSQLSAQRVVGAPDFVVEILSKSTEDTDRTTKKTQYGLYDVLEYWLVHPTDEYVEVYHNHDHALHLVQTASKTDRIASLAIEGLVVDLARVF